MSKSTFGVLQLTFQGTSGFATVGHLIMVSCEGGCNPAIMGFGLRSVLNLKLDDPEADVERLLVTVRTG